MRLIDADALFAEAMADGAYGYVDAKQIADAPTIDAVPVVRCKNCKWWVDLDQKNRYTDCYCHMVECSTDPDWYCAYGRWKDDE